MALPDLPNFRDAGGLATGSLRPGVVFRSSQLADATEADQRALVTLGVTIVFDLRTARASAARPDQLPAGVRVVTLDVLADAPTSGATAMERLVTGNAAGADIGAINDAVGNGRAHALMIQTYRDLVLLPSARSAYRTFLEAFADGDGAAVVHCTAGKDRTGWAIALLQHIAGTSDDDIVADYLRSSDPIRLAYTPMLEAFGAAGGDATALADMIMVRPEYLSSAIATATDEFGSVDEYLRSGLGVDDETVARVRTRLGA